MTSTIPAERRSSARRGIPIPSCFTSTTPETAKTADGTKKKSHTSNATVLPPRNDVDQQLSRNRTTSSVVAADWTNDHLVCLDRFLVLHFQKQRTSQLLALDDFYAVARKALALIRSSSRYGATVVVTAAEHNDNQDDTPKTTHALPPVAVPDALMGLTEEERLLYHLVAALSPTLYRLRRIPAKELHAWSPETRDVWCLEAITALMGNNNRKQQLNKLLEQKSVARAKCDFILEAIRGHRDDSLGKISETKKKPISASTVEAPTTTKVSTNPLEALIQPGMTVEQRVRLRAFVKEQEDASRKAVSALTGEDSTVDGEWLVRLADALWSYASNLRTSQTRFLRPSAPTSQSCNAALRDVVMVLRNSLVTGKTSGRMPMNVTKGEKVSKRQIVDAVMEVQKRFPNWITITDPDAGSAKESPSKDAVVRINAVDYTVIRQQLVVGTSTPATSILNSEKTLVARQKTPSIVNSILHPRNPFDRSETAVSSAQAQASGATESRVRKAVQPVTCNNNNNEPVPKKSRTTKSSGAKQRQADVPTNDDATKEPRRATSPTAPHGSVGSNRKRIRTPSEKLRLLGNVEGGQQLMNRTRSSPRKHAK